MENLDRFEPLGNMAQLSKLVSLADSPAVGYCFDSGHAWAAEVSLVDWIALMGNKLFTTHFHDNHGSQGRDITGEELIEPYGIDEHLAPGFGTIDWRAVIIALNDIKYEEMVNFESGPWPDMDTREGYEAAILYWRESERLAEKALSKRE